MFAEKIRRLCIENSYFTKGYNSQYQLLFSLSENVKNIEEIARMIELYSNDVSSEKIFNQLKEIYKTD